MAENPKIDFFVAGDPAPAVRKSKKDRWAERRCVVREKAWRDLVYLTALRHRDLFRELKYPIYAQLIIYSLKVPPGDGDNYYKCAIDALVYRKLLKNDNLKHIPAHSLQWIRSSEHRGMKIMFYEEVEQ